jgi:FG-GAP-like repeat/FG-GAP repeat
LSYYSLTVLINRGDGSFPNPTTWPVSQLPSSAVTGDFNGDGHADIATISVAQPGGVSVLLGKGDGTFQAHVDSPAPSPSTVAAGDFDGDGKLDLVVGGANSTNELLATLIGKGDGTFSEKTSQTVSGIVRSIAVGDFNGDGKLDVAATIDNINGVSIFLGHGDGSFAVPVQYPAGPMGISAPYSTVLAGDFNADGKLDLAVATDNGIAVLLGNGDGTFRPFTLVASLYPTAPGDTLLVLADFNGDGKLDIIKATQNGASTINVALGNGDGTFQQAAGFQIPSILDIEAAVVGDFNGDGKLDLAFTNQAEPMTILFGNGDGTFQGHIEYVVPQVTSLNSLVAADFNGDGALDLAMADLGPGGVTVFINQPVAAFAPRTLKFANQGIDTTSSAQSVTLTNSGAAPLSIASIATTGDFSEINDCGTSLVVGKACTVNVGFSATADGARSGWLSFTDNASVVPQMIALSGTGTGAGFLVGVAPGSSASQTVTAGQTASYSLTFSPAGGFTGTVTLTCATSPAGANCAAPATVALTGTSPVTATINVGTTAVASTPFTPEGISVPPFFLNFNLRGLGLLLGTVLMLALLATWALEIHRPVALTVTVVTMLAFLWAGCGGGGGGGAGGGTQPSAPAATVSPSSMTFSSENQGATSPAQNVTLSNTGNAALSISSIALAGSNATDFQQTNTCGSSVAVGANCAIGVTFMPTATGSRTATLVIGDNATGSPQQVNLSGTSVPPATQTGSYAITVTATSGSRTQTMHLTLNVQ